MTTAFTTVLADAEIIVGVCVPKWTSSVRWGYFKLCRKVGEFPLASAAVVIAGQESRVFIGALADKPRPLAALARILSTATGDVPGETLKESLAEAAPEIDDIDRRIYITCLARAIEQAFYA
jgi:carbon-monoxide dehydrogenase medium subunit